VGIFRVGSEGSSTASSRTSTDNRLATRARIERGEYTTLENGNKEDIDAAWVRVGYRDTFRANTNHLSLHQILAECRNILEES
jgi:enhancing lycopene biosynthesis protein 2